MGEILNGLMEALRIAKRSSLSEAARKPMPQRPATYTHDDSAAAARVGHLYYFRLSDRAPGPYLHQRHVEAIIDIAADGTLAGVELIDDMPPPPPRSQSPPPDRLITLDGSGR